MQCIRKMISKLFLALDEFQPCIHIHKHSIVRTREIGAPFASSEATPLLYAGEDPIGSTCNLIVTGLKVDGCVNDGGTTVPSDTQ